MILRQQHNVRTGDATTSSTALAERSWTDEFRNMDQAITTDLRAKDAKHAAMGEMMWEIVKKEKAMKRQEKSEQRAARKAMRVACEDARNDCDLVITEQAGAGPLWASSRGKDSQLQVMPEGCDRA